MTCLRVAECNRWKRDGKSSSEGCGGSEASWSGIEEIELAADLDSYKPTIVDSGCAEHRTLAVSPVGGMSEMAVLGRWKRASPSERLGPYEISLDCLVRQRERMRLFGLSESAPLTMPALAWLYVSFRVRYLERNCQDWQF